MADDTNKDAEYRGPNGTRGTRDQAFQTLDENVQPEYQPIIEGDVLCVGIVVDEQGHALDGATVEAWDRLRSKKLFSTKTNYYGEWTIHLPSDMYVFAFYKDDIYEVQEHVTIIPETDKRMEYDTIMLDFNPPEFRITPTEKYYIKLLRALLGDNNPNVYELDEPKKYVWDDMNLQCFLHLSLNDLNASPKKTSFLMHEVPDNFRTLIVMGGAVFAIISIGLREVRNKLSYTDAGLQLAIDRPGDYNTVNSTLFTQYVALKKEQKAHIKVVPFVLQRNSSPYMVRTFAPRQWRLR